MTEIGRNPSFRKEALVFVMCACSVKVSIFPFTAVSEAPFFPSLGSRPFVSREKLIVDTTREDKHVRRRGSRRRSRCHIEKPYRTPASPAPGNASLIFQIVSCCPVASKKPLFACGSLYPSSTQSESCGVYSCFAPPSRSFVAS